MSDRAPSDWYREFFRGSWIDIQGAVKGDAEATAREVDWFVEWLRLEGGCRVLDVPCGTGRHAVELARRGFEVLGVDLSPEALAVARERVEESGVSGVELREGDMRELPRDGSFDGGYCWWGSFGYLGEEGDADFLKAVAESLRPGARFAIDTMTLEGLLRHWLPSHSTQLEGALLAEQRRFDVRTARNESTWHFVKDGVHETKRGSIRIYSCHELIGLLEAAGFGDIELHADLEGTEFSLGKIRCHVLATRS